MVLGLIHATPHYVPQQTALDLSAIRCNDDTPFDDHLGEMAISIFVVGTEAGRGPANDYTVSLTATADFQLLTVPGLGHADLFTSPDAKALFWEPVLEWLQTHQTNRTYP